MTVEGATIDDIPITGSVITDGITIDPIIKGFTIPITVTIIRITGEYTVTA
ncbi:MAG: hypothetical protein N2235_14450 [Fischerella sp.]|nr:hypothetical protein [Fischerella sp.]